MLIPPLQRIVKIDATLSLPQLSPNVKFKAVAHFQPTINYYYV